MRYTSFGPIIDDIVFPDGRTAMGVLGGGGTYAVAGMRVWNADVGLLGNVGSDFDTASLDGLDIASSGLRVNDRPTPRAWQLFEEDGQRTQIPRIPLPDWEAQLAWPDDIVEYLASLGVQAVHMLSRGAPGDAEALARVAAMGVRISLEPIIEDGMTLAERAVVLDCLPYVEIFSPGTQELHVLLGDISPAEGLRELAARGPKIVALRRGASGSLVYERERELLLHVPAAPVNVIDVTGGGNAYAGGMLVGWCETGDLRHASACAGVSAALALEQIGPPTITAALLAGARDRHAGLIDELRVQS